MHNYVHNVNVHNDGHLIYIYSLFAHLSDHRYFFKDWLHKCKPMYKELVGILITHYNLCKVIHMWIKGEMYFVIYVF